MEASHLQEKSGCDESAEAYECEKYYTGRRVFDRNERLIKCFGERDKNCISTAKFAGRRQSGSPIAKRVVQYKASCCAQTSVSADNSRLTNFIGVTLRLDPPP